MLPAGSVLLQFVLHRCLKWDQLINHVTGYKRHVSVASKAGMMMMMMSWSLTTHQPFWVISVIKVKYEKYY